MSDCNAQGSVEHNMPRGCELTQTKPTPDPRPTTTVQALDNLQQTPNQAQTHTTPTPECNTRPKPRFLKSLSGASHPASAFSIRVRWPRRENRNRPCRSKRESARGPVRGGYTQPTRLRSFLLTAISFLFSCSRCTLKRTFPLHHRN